jgi:hypothetical protein
VTSFFVATTLAQSPRAGAAPPASKASATFCADSPQLQMWISQGTEPGLDQYFTGPGEPVPFEEANAEYLAKLATEAPPAIQLALLEWANFVKAVVPGPSVATLKPLVPGTVKAQNDVETWLTYESGCHQVYPLLQSPGLTPPPNQSTPTAKKAGGSGSSHLWWWIGGGFVVLLILGGAASSSSESSSGGRQTVDGGGGRARPTSSSWQPSGPTTRSCSSCGGSGHVPCSRCGGRGLVYNGNAFAGSGNEYRPCDNYACRGGQMDCNNCQGHGTVSA